MTTNSKQPEAQPLPAEEQPRPGPMPTEGEGVREEGRRAHDDARSGKKDTDEAGYDEQRSQAPAGAPTKRSGISDGSDG